jgi:hypothetical protein
MNGPTHRPSEGRRLPSSILEGAPYPVPGVKESDIDITVTGNRLIHGAVEHHAFASDEPMTSMPREAAFLADVHAAPKELTMCEAAWGV